jgi:DNA-directed RNA polymerase specialized sigma subunit
MKQDRFREVEQMYRSYQRLKIKLDLLQPRNVQIFSQTPVYHDQHSKVEAMAIERLEIERKIKLIQACLAIMTRDERLFIEYRYFQEKDMEMVPVLLNWSRRETFRLRQSVLAKTRWFLSLESLDNNNAKNAC